MTLNLKMDNKPNTPVTFTNEEEVSRPRIGISYEGNKLYAPIGLGWDKKGLYSRVYSGKFKALHGLVSKRDDPVLENPVRSVTAAYNSETNSIHFSFDDDLFALIDTSKTVVLRGYYWENSTYPSKESYTNISISLDKEMTVEGLHKNTVVVLMPVIINGYDAYIYFYLGATDKTDKKATVQVNIMDIILKSNKTIWSSPSNIAKVENGNTLKFTSWGTRYDVVAFNYDDIRLVYWDPYTEDVTVFNLNEEREVNKYLYNSLNVYYYGLFEPSCWFSLLHNADTDEWIVHNSSLNSKSLSNSTSVGWTSICSPGVLKHYWVPVEIAQKIKEKYGIELIRKE